MDYTVREVAVDHIVVDFSNGGWAEVPVQRDWDRARIETEISKFVPFTNDMAFASEADVPLVVGDTGTVGSYYDSMAAAEAARRAVEVTYEGFRSRAYPTLGDQLDALYKARQGDSTELNAIDAEIAQVKTDYPKDMTAITQGEYEDTYGNGGPTP